MFSYGLLKIIAVLVVLSTAGQGLTAMAEEPSVPVIEQAAAAQEEAPVSKPTAADEAQAQQREAQIFLDALSGGDSESFHALLQTMLQGQHETALRQAAEKRTRLLQALPEELRAQVETTRAAFQELAEKLKLENFFTARCKVVYDVVQKLPEGHALRNDILDELKALNGSIQSGTFLENVFPRQLNGNPFDLEKIITNMMRVSRQQPEVAFELKDVALLRENLNKSLEAIPSDSSNEAVRKFIELLELVEDNDGREICHVALDALIPEFDSIFAVLGQTISALADMRLALSPDAEPSLKEALEHWIAHFKTHRRTLVAFRAMASTAEIDLSFILRKVSQIHEVSSAFFWANRYDVWGASNQWDLALRLGMASGLLVHRRGEAAYTELQKYMVAGESLRDFVNPFNSVESNLMIALQAVPVMFNPIMFGDRMHPVNRAFFRIVGSYFWYVWQTKNLDWQSKDEGIRIAFAATIKEAQYAMGSYIQHKLDRMVSPATQEKIETYSLGLLKPELANLILEILIPSLCIKQKMFGVDQVVDFGAKDLLRYDFWFYKHKYGQWKEEWKKDNTKDLDTYMDRQVGHYIEYLILDYVCSNVGKFCGDALARQFQGPIISILNGAVRSMETVIGLFVNETEEDDAADAARHSKMLGEDELKVLKALLISAFHENTPERSMVVGFLKNHRLIKEDLDDPISINDAIVNVVVNYLSDYYLLKHSQVAKLVRVYYKNSHNVTPFLDQLFETLKGNVIGAAGGLVGRIAGSYLAWRVTTERGPLYPGLKQRYDHWRNSQAGVVTQPA